MPLRNFTTPRGAFWVFCLLTAGLVCLHASHLAGQDVKYRWRAGDIHHYTLNIESEFEETNIRISGTIELRVKGPVADSSNTDGHRLPATQLGTGLFFKPNYLVTSRDLVDQAGEITVEIAGTSVSAKTVATDEFSNLALLELAESFELSNLSVPDAQLITHPGEVIMLVSSLPQPKLLRAKVKGYQSSKSGGDKRKNEGINFYIDADQRAGLLGAPTVDSAGNIIGLITKQRPGPGARWSATPSEKIHELLKSHSIELTNAKPLALDTDQKLIEHFQRHLIPVSVNREATGDSLSQIDFSGSYTTDLTGKNRFAIPDFPQRESDSGKLLVSQVGKIIRFEGDDHLPFLLGPLGSFPIEPLDNNLAQSWRVELPTSVATTERFGPFGFYGVPSHFNLHRNERITSTTAAVEKIDYEISEVEPPLLTINKNYELVTLDHTQHPAFRFTGKGTIRFDTNLNAIVSSQFTGTLERSTRNTTLRLPVKVSLIRKTTEQLAAERKKAMERAEAERMERETPFTEKEMAKIIEDLKSGEWQTQLQAMAKLTKKSPKQGNSELARFLIEHINDEQITRIHYRQALEKWATPDIGPQLLEHIGTTDDSFLRPVMMRLVTKFKTPGAVAVVAPYLASRRDRSQAEQSLKQFGADAEEPTLKHLSNDDRWVRHSVISVLAVVGTEKSISALEEIAGDDKDRNLQYAAQRALKSIKSRK